MITASGDQPIYSVSELNEAVRWLLVNSFPLLWVEGELSNLARPASGHWYFSLKDDRAQVRCAMFRNKNRLLRLAPADGMQVLIRARVGLYSPRGEYQLIVEDMEEAGEGALRRAFEQLRAKLADEGLFDESIKRPLPDLPRTVGVITSGTGAAIRDVLSVLRRRFPLGRVVIYPVPVQGGAAAAAIEDALARAGRRADADALLLVRGGGSLEDLWSFNEERVARAVRTCPIPVVVGVGHEVDVTIADFAADLRAPTPSAAAELVCPDQTVWRRRLTELRSRLGGLGRRHLREAGRELTSLERRLQRCHPQRRLHESMQRLDEMEARLRRGAHAVRQHQRQRLEHAMVRLHARHPGTRIEQHTARVDQLHGRLCAAMRARLEQAGSRYRLAARSLDGLSPLKTLERGYSIAMLPDGRVLSDAGETRPGEPLRLRLHRGSVDCEVTGTTDWANGPDPDMR